MSPAVKRRSLILWTGRKWYWIDDDSMQALLKRACMLIPVNEKAV